MNISNSDLDLLEDIELYLFSKINNKNIVNNNFIVDAKNVDDKKALELYLKLYSLVETKRKMKEDKNKKNWQKIKEKRKQNKYYARSKKEIERYERTKKAKEI